MIEDFFGVKNARKIWENVHFAMAVSYLSSSVS